MHRHHHGITGAPATPDGAVTVTAVGECPALTKLVCAASADAELVHNTYLPADLTVRSAHAWITQQPRTTWVICVDGEPVGLAKLTPAPRSPILVDPGGSWESETWLIAQHRGRGVASRAWRSIQDVIAAEHPDITTLVAVVWQANHASHRRLRKDGYRAVGRMRWGGRGQGHGGWCVVWVRAVASPVSDGHRDAAA